MTNRVRDDWVTSLAFAYRNLAQPTCKDSSHMTNNCDNGQTGEFCVRRLVKTTSSSAAFPLCSFAGWTTCKCNQLSGIGSPKKNTNKNKASAWLCRLRRFKTCWQVFHGSQEPHRETHTLRQNAFTKEDKMYTLLAPDSLGLIHVLLLFFPVLFVLQNTWLTLLLFEKMARGEKNSRVLKYTAETQKVRHIQHIELI